MYKFGSVSFPSHKLLCLLWRCSRIFDATLARKRNSMGVRSKQREYDRLLNFS